MNWTPEQVRELANDSYCDERHHNNLLDLVDFLEAQQAELDAARRVIDAYHAYDKYVGDTPCPDCFATGSRNVEEASEMSVAIFDANNNYDAIRADTSGGTS